MSTHLSCPHLCTAGLQTTMCMTWLWDRMGKEHSEQRRAGVNTFPPPRDLYKSWHRSSFYMSTARMLFITDDAGGKPYLKVTELAAGS